MFQICELFWKLQCKGRMYTWIKVSSQRDTWIKGYILFSVKKFQLLIG